MIFYLKIYNVPTMYYEEIFIFASIMITLYLVRHGETEENAAHILQGQTPGHLSSLGREQAEKLRDILRPIFFDVLVSSDLKRCIDTADILNQERKLPLHLTKLLRERDWGSFTGRMIPTLQGIAFPEDVETLDTLLERSTKFIAYLKEHFDGMTVLAIGHGLVDRAIQSVVFGKPMKDIERMGNATYRILEIK